MSQESIRSLLEAHGSFPDETDARANFEALFALARDGGESAPDLAAGFAIALDQWSHVDAQLDPGYAARLRDWVLAAWTTAPHDLLAAFCRLLVNVPSPEVVAFLQRQLAQATDADVQQALRVYLGQVAPDGAGG